MQLDIFLKTYLFTYYVLIVFVIGVLFLLNVSKEKRKKQLGLAKIFLIFVGILSLCLVIGYSVKDSRGADVFAFFVFCKELINPRTELYETLSVIGLIVLFLGKIVVKLSNGHTRKENSALTQQSKNNFDPSNNKPYYNVYSSNDPYNYSSNNKSTYEQLVTPEKEPGRIEKFFFIDEGCTERRDLAKKIFLVIAIALVIFYMLNPIIVSLFEVEFIFSSVGVLLFIIAFLECFYALDIKEEEKKPVKEKKKLEDNSLQNYLKNILKMSAIEHLRHNEKMVGNSKVILSSASALVCEVTNSNEIKEINLKIMNTAFFEKKRVLVVSINNEKAKNYHSRLLEYNKEYDGKLIIKLLTEEDKLFDTVAEIYVTAIENCFGNIKLLSEIDTIIFEDYEELLMNKLELFRALGGILKMGNPKMSFVVLSFNFQGIEATLKSLLHVNTVNYYCPENKQQPSEIEVNVWEGNPELISDRVFKTYIKNIGSLVPLALLGAKKQPDRILMVSNNEPIKYQLNELNSIRNLYETSIDNSDIKLLSDRVRIFTNEKYFNYCKKNWIITDDKYNLYEKIYKLTLINGEENTLNIASEMYMLRDYMISTYYTNKSKIKEFMPYVPYEVNSGKVVLYNLILQLTNYGVKESVIYNIFNEYNIKIELVKGNNIKYIANGLNEFISREFEVDIDVFSYLSIREENDKYVFDATLRKYQKEETIYVLDDLVLRLFPNELFEKISFIKDGFPLNIDKEYAFNFFQKYLPGQKHLLGGYVYEIRNIVKTDIGINAVLENSTTYDNNTYRQDRDITLTSEFIPETTKTNHYPYIICKYYMGTVSYNVETKGYYEFLGGISLDPGYCRYVELDNDNKEKTFRKHKNADVIKIEIDRVKSNKVKEGNAVKENQILGSKIAFLISEVLYSMLGENYDYIQVKSVNDGSIIDEGLMRSIKVKKCSNESIEIYILEDAQIERGIIDMIYKNLDNIFQIIRDYLKWMFDDKIPNVSDTKRFARENNISINEAKKLLDKNEKRTKFLLGVDKSPDVLETYKVISNIISASVIK